LITAKLNASCCLFNELKLKLHPLTGTEFEGFCCYTIQFSKNTGYPGYSFPETRQITNDNIPRSGNGR